MISTVLATLTMAAAPSAQAEYNAYVEQFLQTKAICGTMVAVSPSADPVGQVFRVAEGGKYRIFYGDRDHSFDGTEETTYYPNDHSYLVSRHDQPTFRVVFGPRFGTQRQRPDRVESVRTEVFQGEEVRVFRMDINSKVYPEVLVRKSDHVPVAFRGSSDPKSLYRIVSFDATQTFSEESWNWKPPEGARRRT
jgi:hypothetical protein